MGNVPLLNGLRGLAVLGVVWQHLFWIFNVPGTRPLEIGWLTLAGNPLASNGWMGVNLFFFCSGFVLYLPYCTGRRHFATPQDRVWFWRHRAVRLLPLFYLSLLVGIAVSVSGNEYTHPSVWAQTVLALSGLYVLFPWSFMPIGNGVLWSLGVEVLYSAVFPYLEGAARRIGMSRLLLLAVPVCMLFRAAGHVWFHEPGLYLNFLSDGLAGRLEDFLWGMLCAWAFAAGRLPAVPLMTSLGVLLLLGSAVLSDWWFAGWIPIWSQAMNFSLFDMGAFLLVAGLLARRSWLRSCLEWPPLQLVGMMCFSIYAWHAIVYTQMFSSAERHSLSAVLIGLPAYLLLVAALACASYRFIEFPQRHWREIFLPARSASGSVLRASQI